MKCSNFHTHINVYGAHKPYQQTLTMCTRNRHKKFINQRYNKRHEERDYVQTTENMICMEFFIMFHHCYFIKIVLKLLKCSKLDL
jgi:hypothetical protein